MRRRLLIIVLALAACAPADSAEVAVESTVEATTSTIATTAPQAPSTSTTEAEPLVNEQPEAVDNGQPEAQAASCVRLTDFTDADENERWLVVNDDVMGGRSDGGRSFGDSTMTFFGDINTNGGGFASLRLPLFEGVLVDASHVVIRARPDGREYKLRFRDTLDGRDRRENLQAIIPFGPPVDADDGWQEVSVALADLQPVVFGRPIEGQPFRADLATRLGLMVSDGIDGEFSLEVDWIDICR